MIDLYTASTFNGQRVCIMHDETGNLLSTSLQERAKIYEWMHFHVIDIGVVLFSAFFLQRRCLAKQITATSLRRDTFPLLKSKALYPNSSHALRGNSSGDTLRPVTQSIFGGIPTQSMGTMFRLKLIAEITALLAVIAQENSLSDFTRWLPKIKQGPTVQRDIAVTVKEVSYEI